MQAALLALLLAQPDATTLESHYGRLETERRIYRPLDRVRVSVTGRAGGRRLIRGAGSKDFWTHAACRLAPAGAASQRKSGT
ncbi:MAG: hypothetical protein KatS3mg004_3400 [Bryobacteraceae bacterium]|nr:MAG: hypothetical protein KatS3mg004_3400 [Bryobacteraceae bacterium]